MTLRALVVLLALIASLAVLSAPAIAQPPVPGPPSVLDGSVSDPAGLSVSIARDGTGGLVYLKALSGTQHVFVSPLVNGSFQTPVQVDAQLSGASSQPVIAAGDDGVLLVAFLNGGQLYVVQANAPGEFTPPTSLASGAINPAISMSSFGKAYLTFATADGGGYDVRTAYYYNGSWALETTPLNAVAADDAGTGGGRPAVATAGDGIAVVVWGEQGHIYSRRVWGTQPSIVYEQADAPPAGCTQESVDDPVVGAGGDSSYAAVAFNAILYCDSRQDSRVLMNRLQGSVYDGVAEVDGLAQSSTDGATDPQIEVGEYGSGWVTSTGTSSDDVFAGSVAANASFAGTVSQVNSLAASAQPYAVPAVTGLHSNLIAWQQLPGTALGGDVRVRFAPDGVTLGPETVLSSPAQGSIDAADGLGAAGDTSGDVAVAWFQGPPSASELVVGQMYEPPGGFSPTRPSVYTSNPQPVLAWGRPSGWGPMSYSVTLDGAQLSHQSSTSLQVPAPLGNGPHYWQVTATNPAGQQSQASAATVFVDTVPPNGVLKLHARVSAKSLLHVVVRYFDRPPPGEPAGDASGVAKVVVHWGDGSTLHVRFGTHHVSHSYKRPGRYRVTLVITDRAGNVTRIVKYVKVVKPGHHVKGSHAKAPAGH